MKTKVLVTLSLILFVMAGLVKAEEKKTDAGRKDRPGMKMHEMRRDRAPKAPDPRGRGRSGQSREQMIKDMQSRRNKVHQAALQELKDIKKLAEEEGATKTAEAIQKLIDKKDAEYKQEIQRFEQIRRQRAEMVQKRAKDRDAKKTPGAVRDTDDDKKHDKDDDD